VRETFTEIDSSNIHHASFKKSDIRIAYKADYTESWNNTFKKHGNKWKPSIYMPRAACRIRLEIINVRIERLQEITEQDATNEGMVRVAKALPDCKNVDVCGQTFRASFKELWQFINGTDSWVNNPWVWVIEFKRINK
jgi:hypothetical protein